MNFIWLAILGYLFLAFEAVAGKYLLVGKIKNWRLYLFYVSLLSLFSLVFSPFGLSWWGWSLFFLAFFSGIIFFFSLSFLFYSLSTSAASRVYILFGAISTFTTFILMKIFLEENLKNVEIVSIFLLLLGSFFISFKFSQKRFFHNYRKIILSGFLAGLSLVLLKYVYDETNFISGYVYSRLGIFGMAVILLMIPFWRKKTFVKNKKKQNKKPFLIILPVKILAGIGTILISYSISIGSLTIVNALVSVQYLSTFLLTAGLAFFLKEFSKEKVSFIDLIFKLTGVFLIVVGVIILNFF